MSSFISLDIIIKRNTISYVSSITSSLHHLVEFALYMKLGMFSLHAFKFDGNLLS